MYYPTKIIDINIKKDEKIRLATERRNKALESANYFKKKQLLRIQKLLDGLVRLIESSSGWIYTTDSFVLRSDYHYNGDKKDITFKTNIIRRGENGYYLRQEPSPREETFYTVYKEVLDKIFALEEKRERIYQSLSIPDENVIDFAKIKSRQIRRRWNNPEYTRDVTMALAIQFINNYGTDGIRRLVHLLNRLTDIKDPIDAYNDLIRERISPDYIETLFRWAAMYSPKGDQVIGHIIDLKLAAYNFDFFNYEEKMTDNIIKLF